MSRAEQFVEVAEKYFEVRFKESQEKIYRDFEKRRTEVYQNLVNVIYEGIAQCQQMSKKVKYIIISILESSTITKSYDLQVAFYDEKIYADDTPVYVYWKPMLTFSKLEEDMAFFKQKVSEKEVRVKDYEMDIIREKYLINHYFFILLFLLQIVPGLFANDKQCSSITNDFQVMFGRYMEKTILIYQSGETT